jgi:hypothetical protein
MESLMQDSFPAGASSAKSCDEQILSNLITVQQAPPLWQAPAGVGNLSMN